MTTTSRRLFIAGGASLGVASLTSVGSSQTAASPQKKDTLPKLLHHVFFCLKNPESEADRTALIAGIKKLAAIETVRAIHVGTPASTEKRDVVETTYQVSELLCFDDLEGQATYQSHPLHMEFVKECSHFWTKVLVYDVLS